MWTFDSWILCQCHLREDEINCWIRGHDFNIELENIDDVLGFEDLEHDFTHYKDKMLYIEKAQLHIGGVREGKCLNTTVFPSDLRCLTIIMMFNLYPVKKMTTISNARAIFLTELRENTYIDISAHAFSVIVVETRTTLRAKLILPSLLMRLFWAKGVEIPPRHQSHAYSSSYQCSNNCTDQSSSAG